MAKFYQILAVLFAAISVAVADALVKKASASGNFWSALKHPLMLIVVLLYLVQIALFTYAFVHNWKLDVLGITQVVFYTVTVLVFGYLLFKETLSPVQMLGVGLALVGVVLMNHA